jgi:hypothetical protein
MRRLAGLLAAAACAAGCGGGEPAEPAPAPAPPKPEVSAAERVIRGWLVAIRRGDARKAASYFAVGARVQNGGPPRTLDDPAILLAWNATLPCGAVLIGIHPRTDGFVIADFRLTDRKGSSCGDGLGATAHSAIRVDHGRITDWYRLPDSSPGVEASEA